MKRASKEPTFQFSEEDVIAKSSIAKDMIERRAKQNTAVEEADNKLLKRIYNIDHNAYLEDAVPAKYKELMGLSSSAVLRCDDCIFYHIIQSYRLGCSKEEIESALNIATVVGGTITIPHIRKAYTLLKELYS